MNEETLFNQALDLPPEERAAFLDSACGEDTALRARVGDLIASHEEAESGSFLSGRAAKAEREEAEREEVREEPPRDPGERVAYFGDYELRGEIARGAMGVVYRAEQVSLKREVALKMIRSTFLAGEQEVARFRAEAEAAASLDHPRIVPIYEIGEHEGQHYFTMKLIEGGTLAGRMGHLREHPREAAELMRQVALAVHAAHQRGILHRDLKPGNILVDEAGEPHVTDFGLAKDLNEESQLTLSGQIMGTPHYMSPEQAEGSNRLTTAADIYSLGAVLYEMLAGEPPFRGDTLLEILRRVAEEEPRELRSLNAKVDRDLATIAMKCLRKRPPERYASAQGLAEDLERWLVGRPVLARPVGTAERAAKWVRRKPYQAAAAGLALLLLLTFGIGGPVVGWRQAKLRGQMQQAQEQHHLELARSLESAVPGAVPVLLDTLRRNPSTALRTSLARQAEEGKDPAASTRIAIGRAVLGEMDFERLLADVGALGASDGPNLALALRIDAGLARLRVRDRFDASENLVERIRLAILLLDLGDREPAATYLAPRPDLTQRARFLHEFARWHGDLARMPTAMDAAGDADILAGLCLAVGGVEPESLGPADRAALFPKLTDLYLETPHASVHSAAGWALRRLGGTLPETASSAGPPEGRGWYVNGAGMTMLRVDPGIFLPGDYAAREEGKTPATAVFLTEPYFLQSANVTAAQFQAVVARARALGMEGDSLPAPDALRESHLPIASMRWREAVLFCNALSATESLSPCYLPDAEGGIRFDPDADGYRLPSAAEWEHAFRTGTETRYVTGGDIDRMGDYGKVFGLNKETDQRHRPNPWGFFDMLGNAWETTNDAGFGGGGGRLVNPLGQVGRHHQLRGGSSEGGVFYLHASESLRRQDSRGPRPGHSFRVARGRPGPGAEDLGPEDLLRCLGTPHPDSPDRLALRDQLLAEAAGSSADSCMSRGEWRASELSLLAAFQAGIPIGDAAPEPGANLTEEQAMQCLERWLGRAAHTERRGGH